MIIFIRPVYIDQGEIIADHNMIACRVCKISVRSQPYPEHIILVKDNPDLRAATCDKDSVRVHNKTAYIADNIGIAYQGFCVDHFLPADDLDPDASDGTCS